MALKSTEDLPNKKLSTPIIRTMQDDLKSLKAVPSASKKISPGLSKAPVNLPVDLPSSAKPSKPQIQKNTESLPVLDKKPAIAAKPVEKKMPLLDKKDEKKEEKKDKFVTVPTSNPVKPSEVFREKPPAAPVKPTLESFVKAPSKISVEASARQEIKNKDIPKEEKMPYVFPPRVPTKPVEVKKDSDSAREELGNIRYKNRHFLEEAEEDLSPEARLLKQGSSLNVDLAEENLAGKNDFDKKPVKIGPLPTGQVGVLGGEKVISKFSDSGAGKKNAFNGFAANQSKNISRTAKSGGSKVLKYLAIMLIIAAVSYGAYYFIKVKNPVVVKDPIPELLIPGLEQNELAADLNSDISIEIKKYFKNSSDAKHLEASRLLIKDNSGDKVLKVENFKKALGLAIPDNIIEALDKNYNLIAFNYPEKDYIRLGLLFKIAKPEAIAENAKNWELTMFSDLEPLFLGDSGIADPNGVFKSNVYMGSDIRYYPLGKDNASLNYAIDNNKKFFMIATSKNDIYYLINNIIR